MRVHFELNPFSLQLARINILLSPGRMPEFHVDSPRIVTLSRKRGCILALKLHIVPFVLAGNIRRRLSTTEIPHCKKASTPACHEASRRPKRPATIAGLLSTNTPDSRMQLLLSLNRTYSGGAGTPRNTLLWPQTNGTSHEPAPFSVNPRGELRRNEHSDVRIQSVLVDSLHSHYPVAARELR
jgi:hypothetical protein